MPKTVNYTVTLSGLPTDFKPLKIAHLSDLHGQIPDLAQLTDQIAGLAPHLILMTGDMINAGNSSRSQAGRKDFLALCRALAPICPVFYSMGNHELELPERCLDSWIAKAGRTGITVLDNAQAEFSHDGVTFSVFGLTMPLLYFKDPRRKPYDRHAQWTALDMGRIFGPAPAAHRSGHPSLLMAHNPLYFPAYRDWGADLTFSGHIHGGIFRLPLLGGVLSPDLTLFPKYDGGLYSENSCRPEFPPRRMVVSRGMSDTFLKRVGNPMELVCVTVAAQTV